MQYDFGKPFRDMRSLSIVLAAIQNSKLVLPRTAISTLGSNIYPLLHLLEFLKVILIALSETC